MNLDNTIELCNIMYSILIARILLYSMETSIYMDLTG